MVERITSEWTDTLEEAYGDSEVIKNAVLAEEMYKAFCDKTYDEVRYTPGNRIYQEVGVDIEFKKAKWRRFYTTDVKSNLKEDGSFVVDVSPSGWLRNPKKLSDRIAHIDTKTGWMAEYDRKQMINLINSIPNTGIASASHIVLNSKDIKLRPVVRTFKIAKVEKGVKDSLPIG